MLCKYLSSSLVAHPVRLSRNSPLFSVTLVDTCDIPTSKVHINCCLDASAAGNEALSDVGVSADIRRTGNDTSVMASGRRGK